MGVNNKKTAKGRLDKYYHLAKEQGYRARSAFKLIQLNRKYHFLENTRVLIDLCAAPGGWLQVASKYMPMSHLIIGVDLVPIKPIPGVITLTADIMSDGCRSSIKKELKDWNVDVVLHDGAPNVGSSWIHDAYSQAELVLMSLKLTTEFLKPGGLFITKVFRSKDYNALMWVFSQLFKKVEATKPASSRNVSAEIFVVCQDYLAPKKIDPKFLDPKSVFKDLDIPIRPLNIFHPEKHTRQRQGYEDGATMLFKSATVKDFFVTEDPASFLGTFHKIIFSDSEEKKYLDDLLTTDDIKVYCDDLKLLGRREFKSLLKWRLLMIKQYQLDDLSLESRKNKDGKEEFQQLVVEEELSDLEQLENMISEDTKKLRKQKKKILMKRAKERERVKLGMNVENAEYIEDQELFNVSGTEVLELDEVVNAHFESEEDMRDTKQNTGSESQSEFEFSDNEQLDDQLEDMYKQYQSTVASKNINSVDEFALVESKEMLVDTKDSFYNTEQIDDVDNSDADSSNAGSENDIKDKRESLNVSLLNEEEMQKEKMQKVGLLFARPIFRQFEKGTTLPTDNIRDVSDPSKPLSNQDQVDEPLASGRNAKENKSNEILKKGKRTKIGKKLKCKANEEMKGEVDNNEIEFVKSDCLIEPEEYTVEDKMNLLTPEGMTLALQLRDKKKRKELMDGSFSRYAFEDPGGLPSWFRDDENQHNKPQLPVSKEAIEVLKAKLKTIQSKPTKKALEAKLRNRMKMFKKLESIKSKAGLINESEELTEAQKSAQIHKMLRNGSKKSTKKNPVTVVVAKGSNRGNKTRPKGVKGRYKMVDRRMKKEVRAFKRNTKLKRKRKH